MQCQRCQQKDANVHITQIVNGEKQETHLCQECAQDMKISLGLPPLPSQNLTNLLGFLTQTDTGDKKERDTKCPNCSIPYKKIREAGCVGCSECYHYFNSYLDPILRKIHGTNRHSGKTPKRLGGSYMIKRQIEDLKRDLKQEVEKERYEEAARIRDEIIALEEKMARGDDR
ncbi:MAG: hypothetical protein CVU87_09985 [Firmicutes bacterium HGW-Firmicutes-12]|nr:MAG: hypothetical protein CVU87_09985 [Firmicutes bacterium HGW-Firmicutes-12]